MPLAFTPSRLLTLGVEVELQILHPGTRDLTPGAPDILARLGALGPRVRPELFQSMLEVTTGIHETVADVRRDLEATYAEVRSAASAAGLRVATAGSHPFARHRERVVSDTDRYRRLIDRNRWAARRLMVFGLHVHVGMPDGDRAIATINGLLPYLPHLLALSASSPFWQGADTGLASSRTTVFEALPTAGHPCVFRDWRDFEHVCDAMLRSRSITSIKDLWWDIRPQPELGTVEVRVCDGLPTLSETVALAGVVHSLCAWLENESRKGHRAAPPDQWVLRENKWRASRWGLEAELVVAPDGRTEPVRGALADLFDALAAPAERVGAADAVAAARAMLRQVPSYERQRAVFAQHGSLTPVVDALMAEWETDLAGQPA